MGLVDERSVVVELVSGGGEEGSSRVMVGGLDRGDGGPLGEVSGRDVTPGVAAILGDVDEAVVGAYPQET